jgi:hypothetical protein
MRPQFIETISCIQVININAFIKAGGRRRGDREGKPMNDFSGNGTISP